MSYIEFDKTKKYDLIPLGRVAIDFNPTDMNKPLSESSNFNKYVGGSPANIAVGMARLGKKVGFIGKVSDDQFGDYVINYFKNDGIDVSHITRCKNGENLGLTFTEIKSPSEIINSITSENSLTDFLIQRLNKLTEDSDFERKIKDNILQRLPEASFEELTELLHNVSSDNTLSTTSVMELFKLNDNDKNITDALKEDNISNAATELYNSTDDKNVLQALTYLGQIMEQMSTPINE